MGIMYQVIGTVILCTVSFNTGVISYWPATAIVMFSTNNTVLDRPMTVNEISLISSLSSIGGMVITLAAGFLMDKLGRKKCTIMIALSLTFSWTALAVSKQVEVILLGVFMSGIGNAIFLVIIVYIGEICQETIRGTMIAANMVFYGTGVTMLYLLAACLNYDALIYVGTSMSVAFLVLLFFLKDSPVHLMRIGKEQEAAKSIAFFRQLKVDDKEVIDEINAIKSALNPEFEESTPEGERLNPGPVSQNEKMSFWQIMSKLYTIYILVWLGLHRKSESSRRALFLTNVVLMLSLFQGLTALVVYTESLFSEAIPSVSPMTCTILEAAIIVIGGTVAAYLADITGRRPLIIYGSIATGLCCIIQGTQLQFHWGPNWISAILMYAYPVAYTVGAGTVPCVLIAELFLPEVRSILSMICVEATMLWSAILLYSVNPILNTIGWGPVYYIFAIISFTTALFSHFFLPETKGLTIEEIQPLFQKKKNQIHS